MNRFVFAFIDSDFEDKGHTQPAMTYFFDLEKAEDITFDEGTLEGEAVLEFAEEVEEDYGVHDWSTTSDPTRGYNEVVGYHSYEVPADKWDELIKKWHAFFTSEGFEPGMIQALASKDYYTQFYPSDTYNEAED